MTDSLTILLATPYYISSIFFFTDPATTEIYTLSLHDALPIYRVVRARHRIGRELDLARALQRPHAQERLRNRRSDDEEDRKSTRLNSSHVEISYAVFCLKKKKIRSLPK